jgi:hypothetical protein
MADGPIATLRRLLAIARPGLQYPDARGLELRLKLLELAGGDVDLDPRSGLPSLRALSSVDADRALARDFLRDHATRLPERAPYFQALAEAELEPLLHVSVRLMTRAGRTSRVQVIRDLFEPASGCLVRFTAVVEQQGDRQVSFERGDLSRASPAFAAAVERCAAGDAELGLLALSEVEGIRVEEVVRGQVGPVTSARLPRPALLAPVVSSGTGAILHLALERAGPAVAEDRGLDPFAPLYRDSLSAQARAPVEARREALGYRVVKERRLVCTPEVEGPLRGALSAAGVKLVVRAR